MWYEDDRRHMHAALNIASRGLGRVAPNPSVGCVLVRDGRVVGRGRTGDGGHPHAEEVALQHAGGWAEGATAYVTLEPCSARPRHTSCCDHLISAGVARVVAACGDLNPAIDGRGLEKLRQAGMQVETGLMEAQARELHAGFFARHVKNRPLVSLKCATSQDGKLATIAGQSQWITSKQARRHSHMLRAHHDATLTGIGTVLEDDPRLTSRLPGIEHNGRRIVLDPQARLPLDASLFQDCATHPLYCVIDPDRAATHKMTALRDAGAVIIEQNPRNLEAVLNQLANAGLTRILVEAGPKLLSAFVRSGLYDQLFWYQAPAIIGDDGMGVFTGLNIRHIQDIRRHSCKSISKLGPDHLNHLIPEQEAGHHV